METQELALLNLAEMVMGGARLNLEINGKILPVTFFCVDHKVNMRPEPTPLVTDDLGGSFARIAEMARERKAEFIVFVADSIERADNKVPHVGTDTIVIQVIGKNILYEMRQRYKKLEGGQVEYLGKPGWGRAPYTEIPAWWEDAPPVQVN